MNARRAGQGEVETRELGGAGPRTRPVAGRPPAPRLTLADDPAIAAALGYARADVEALEQTEAYWRAVWSEEQIEAG